MYLLNHRSTKHSTPEQIAALAKWDTNPHTKKDAATRIAELRSALLPGLFTVRTVLCPAVAVVWLCLVCATYAHALTALGDLMNLKKVRSFFPS